ncbi:PH domain-containing protein [Taibaiella soli]|uniref:Bacterial Pleckstrin homology domain-containing protein n=1 Tax=Taibaiella soli TaxID=1649169 RepID=A0A2W2AAM5_9BACT|nr:PH domain-containing protein [Taibaiella soli]PZF72445.1 hypothetical protein DN068_13930 [Taibaiella soli]
MQYLARLDGLAKGVTIAVMALFVGTVFYAVQAFFDTKNQDLFLVTAFLVIVSAVTYFSKPTSFSIDEYELVVHRPHGVFRTPVENIVSIERIDRKSLGWGIRLFGSGGFFGYLGIFYYGSIGRVSMYCTNRKEMLLVITEKSRFIISPENSNAFLAEWKNLNR